MRESNWVVPTVTKTLFRFFGIARFHPGTRPPPKIALDGRRTAGPDLPLPFLAAGGCVLVRDAIRLAKFIRFLQGALKYVLVNFQV